MDGKITRRMSSNQFLTQIADSLGCGEAEVLQLFEQL